MQAAPVTELKALLRLAGPLIASQLAHMLMLLTDTLMMARISPEALAGGGLGAASYSFVSIFCLGVIAAVGTLVERKMAGHERLYETKPLSLQNGRLIVAGWFSNNAREFTIAQIVVAILLGAATFVVLRQGRKS